MSERKAWTMEEDTALKELYQLRNLRKWAEISRLMSSEFHLDGRTGKQCRQRYHNHLDQSINHQKFTTLEQQQLINAHHQLGNKWAEISRVLIGRSQNDIKNQFYSLLRRSVRQINLVIRKKLKRYKEIQMDNIVKLVEICEVKKDTKRKINRQFNEGMEFKKNIMRFAFGTLNYDHQEIATIKKIIERAKDLGKKDGSKEKGVKIEEKESEEIESAELRDNFPALKKQEVEGKFRKNSFFTFTLEQPQEELVKIQSNPLQPYPMKLRDRTSFCSNGSVEITSPKQYDQDTFLRLFQIQSESLSSPKPIMNITSPYFDQYKNNFTSWNQYFNH